MAYLLLLLQLLFGMMYQIILGLGGGIRQSALLGGLVLVLFLLGMMDHVVSFDDSFVGETMAC